MITEQMTQFVRLYNTAEGNADSDTVYFMQWCDDNRHFLLEAVRDQMRINWLQENMPTLAAQISGNAISTPTLRDAITERAATNWT